MYELFGKLFSEIIGSDVIDSVRGKGLDTTYPSVAIVHHVDNPNQLFELVRIENGIATFYFDGGADDEALSRLGFYEFGVNDLVNIKAGVPGSNLDKPAYSEAIVFY